MPINKDQSGTPKPKKVKVDLVKRPPDEPKILPPVIEEWWKRWQEREDFHKPMSIEDRQFRGSFAGYRCERALWYAVNKEPESNPSGPVDHWRMATGTLVHLLLDDHVGPGLKAEGFNDVFPEMPIDLQPLGLNGASSADLVALNHTERRGVAVELKTKGGFKFKKCTTSFNGGPLGPELGDVVQAVLAGEGVKARYPNYDIEVRVVYLALENVSVNLAAQKEVSEFGRFMAEWVISDEECKAILDYEIPRINAVLADPMVPERIIDDVDGEMPLRRMEVTDVDKGAMTGDIDGAIVYGRTWRCGYCRWQKTCKTDG